MTDATDTITDPNVMIDIETLGTEPGCAIVSIGVVRFDVGGVIPDSGSYWSVDIESCQSHGLTIDAETLKWWLKQPDVVQEQLRGGYALPGVLAELSNYIDSDDVVWANPPKFDAAILEAAYGVVDQDVPWKYWNLRDSRTLFETFDHHPKDEFDGQDHVAIDDARQQAEIVAATLRAGDGDD